MENFFCIIGAQRSGTTYLYKILDEHPEIFLAKPIKPEPKYFLEGNESLLNKDYYLNKYFSDLGPNVKIIGEKSTSYIEYDISNKIKSLFPKSKVIAILRNPVDRAISNYFFSLQNGLEKRSLREVFIEKKPPPIYKNKKISVSPFDYIQRGFYTQYLIPYMKTFGEKFKILIFEEFVDSDQKIRELFRFLNVNEHIKSKRSNEIINASNYEKDENLEEVRDLLSDLYLDEVNRVEKLLNRKILQWRIK